ncbi:hypothetical protein SAMD00019534_054500 [Acytostelium subglobosum LB1]|uniref:hypothetical protein n=1 Tax=Acytostelium subglobosum LB1 TaxID=1410327 RepID=UPI000644FB06|nr:hypothetical protein SAMD00019534_054500 [Acytostelium subglobosum LB1]GAM22275.1 hypothetical protein SAMD00019534_054500 [Acytostelium subglobosum LB1]|eukprot:XP_012754395.1 hypothetical protein SAMD00019534_054500 [Acytostelium subglobosum LB1]
MKAPASKGTPTFIIEAINNHKIINKQIGMTKKDKRQDRNNKKNKLISTQHPNQDVNDVIGGGAGAGGWNMKTSSMADKADRHQCYETAVQSPKADIGFCNKVFHLYRHRKAIHFKEDFSGTGILATEWVKSDPERTALCVDLDDATLQWGMQHHVKEAGAAGERVTMKCANVLDVKDPKVDLIASFNYSICLFHQRSLMLRYFQAAYESLVDDGVLVCDLFGGYQATYTPTVQHRRFDDFVYTWSKEHYNGLTNEIMCSISFSFADKSSLKRSFVYDFRLWTVAEFKEAMLEAGFKDIRVWWRNERKVNQPSQDDSINTSDTRSNKKSATKVDDDDQADDVDVEVDEAEEEVVDENKLRYKEKKQMKQQRKGALEQMEELEINQAKQQEALLEHLGTSSDYIEVDSIPQTASWNVYVVALR